MKKILKTSYLLLSVLLINSIVLSGCENGDSKNKDKSISNYNIEINKENAKAVSITNTEITNISNLDKNKTDIVTKIENTSNFYISKILIGYEELDKNDNIISNSETFLDLTLASGEASFISFPHKEYTKTIKVTSYRYQTENKIIAVNLKNDDVKIKDSLEKIEDSKEYEVLTTSEIYKESESSDTYKIKVKNSSQKNLGNIVLKVGELKNGEYIAINHLPAYNVLKVSEEIEIEIVPSIDATKLKLIGYSYDDIKAKANIDIDLKSHRAKINK